MGAIGFGDLKLRAACLMPVSSCVAEREVRIEQNQMKTALTHSTSFPPVLRQLRSGLFVVGMISESKFASVNY